MSVLLLLLLLLGYGCSKDHSVGGDNGIEAQEGINQTS